MAKYTLEDVERMLEEGDDTPSSGADSYRVAASELRAFIERIEKLEADKAEIMSDVKEVKAEAKARGYDVKVLTKIVSLRKRNRDDIAEEDAVLSMYMEALGML